MKPKNLKCRKFMNNFRLCPPTLYTVCNRNLLSLKGECHLAKSNPILRCVGQWTWFMDLSSKTLKTFLNEVIKRGKFGIASQLFALLNDIHKTLLQFQFAIFIHAPYLGKDSDFFCQLHYICNWNISKSCIFFHKNASFCSICNFRSEK